MQKKSKKSDIDILTSLPVMVDYLLLEDQFSYFKSAKKKIFDLKKKGYLRTVKRGQYFNVKSKFLESTAVETVANSLYFPSYISMEWALQYYGLIMDRVTTVTSVTLLRSKNFKTPYSPFSYKHISKNRYPVGYITKINTAKETFLIARAEKALIDYVNLRATNLKIKTENDIQEFLENDLRLDLSEFLKIVKIEDITEILPSYHRNSKEYRILKWLCSRKDNIHE
jgi:predicted transcriptional regulator of viral defense system